jgi:hypothetical protein
VGRDPIARGGHDRQVEAQIAPDVTFPRAEPPGHLVQSRPHLFEVVVGTTLGRERRHLRLEDPPDLVELMHVSVAHGEEEG